MSTSVSQVGKVGFAILLIVFSIGSAGCKERKRLQMNDTRQLLKRYARECQYIGVTDNQLPAGGMDDLLRQMADRGFLDEECRSQYPGIDKGVDAWGHKIVVEVRPGGSVHFRSKGPDGIDNGGQGDDIEGFVNCTDATSEFRFLNDKR